MFTGVQIEKQHHHALPLEAAACAVAGARRFAALGF